MERPAMCGNCGKDKFMVELHTGPSGRVGYLAVHLVCCECKSKSILTVSAPRIEVGWGDRSEGIICLKGGR